ncbi:MAG: hypothetical protein WC211_00730 [Dehalococcoidia bacterium]
MTAPAIRVATGGQAKLFEWNGERRSISGWARHLKTTRDKIRTRLKLGLRLDADDIGGTYRPLQSRPKRKASQPPAPMPSAPVVDHVAVVALLRAVGYRCEPAVIGGVEVLIVSDAATGRREAAE